eukprot:scaffold121035_cov57-Phaeocystis_antarctica.AAC.2
MPPIGGFSAFALGIGLPSVLALAMFAFCFPADSTAGLPGRAPLERAFFRASSIAFSSSAATIAWSSASSAAANGSATPSAFTSTFALMAVERDVGRQVECHGSSSVSMYCKFAPPSAIPRGCLAASGTSSAFLITPFWKGSPSPGMRSTGIITSAARGAAVHGELIAAGPFSTRPEKPTMVASMRTAWKL